MELLTFTLLYIGGVLTFVFLLLFGEASVFEGTPVGWCHWLITSGIFSGSE